MTTPLEAERIAKVVSPRRRLRWRTRASTLHLRAIDLFADMMEHAGGEHPITDAADEVVETCRRLHELLGMKGLDMWKEPKP